MRFSPDGGNDRPLNTTQTMLDVHDTVARLERQVSRIQTLQFVLLAIIFLLVALVMVYLPRGADSLADACSKLTEEQQQNTLPGI